MSTSPFRLSSGGWGGLLLLGLLSACGGEPEVSPTPSPTPTATPTPTPVPEVIPNLTGPFPYETLSEYQLFVGDMRELMPAKGVLKYEVASPLYSDHALKDRFIVLPEGTSIGFTADGQWDFPDHTILVKNFAFAADMRDPSLGRTLIETRLLIFADGLWSNHTYRWNEEQTEATSIVSGAFLTLNYVGMEGETVSQTYQIPNTVACKNCHGNNDRIQPIAARTRQLNREIVSPTGTQVSQLEYLAVLGAFSEALPSVTSLPALANPWGEDTLEYRARSYLEANCAHCHQPGGAGGPSGLVLLTDETVPIHYGVCKPPVAAGSAAGNLEYDIVPGEPESSIMIYRMHSSEPEIKMPELGNLTVDEQGVALIESWISSMEPKGCE